MKRPRISVAVVAISLYAGSASAADWPQFRGPREDGVAADVNVPLEWSADKNLAWKVAIPGTGWGQPVIVGAKLFLTSAVSDKPTKPADFKAGTDPSVMPKPGEQAKAPDITLEWQVHCVNARSGDLLWSKTVSKGQPKYPIHPSNTYAPETAAADENGVYAFFGATGDVVAYDHAGNLLWQKSLGTSPTMLDFGNGASPALADGRLYVQQFTEKQADMVCFDAVTGNELWRIQREKPVTSWTTPLVWQNRLRTEVVVCSLGLITSHDPRTGAELWRAEGLESSIASTPGSDAERIYFGESQPGKVGPLYAIKAGAKGTISPKDEQTKEFIAWTTESAGAGIPAPTVFDGRVYVLNQSVILSAYDAETGKRIYKERLPDMPTVVASPIVLGDRMLILSEEGVGLNLKAGENYDAPSASKLDDMFWTSPAAVGDSLYLRGVDYLYCVRDNGSST